MPASTINEIFEELRERCEPAIDDVVDSLSSEFPDALVKSIVGGVRKRLASAS
jgi:hypothetical protein